MILQSSVHREDTFDAGADDLASVIAGLTNEFALTAARHDADATFPYGNIRRLHETGILSLTVAKEFGGGGAGLSDALRAVIGVAKGEPSTALILALQYIIHCRNPARNSIAERIVRDLAANGALINILRVEKELGTPVRGGLPKAVARRVDGGWRITASKLYSTGSSVLSWLGVWARTEDDTPLVGSWVVPKGSPGISIIENWNHLGMRASISHEVVFDDVFVPEDHMFDVRPAADWAYQDPKLTAWSMVLFAAIYHGVAVAARDWFVDFLKERKPSNLGTALSEVSHLQQAVGQIDALLLANNATLELWGRKVDEGNAPDPVDSMLVKHNVTSNAIAAVEKAVSLSGNPGISYDNALQRHYRDVLCSRIHSPQADTILTIAGKAALGK